MITTLPDRDTERYKYRRFLIAKRGDHNELHRHDRPHFSTPDKDLVAFLVRPDGLTARRVGPEGIEIPAFTDHIFLALHDNTGFECRFDRFDADGREYEHPDAGTGPAPFYSEVVRAHLEEAMRKALE